MTLIGPVANMNLLAGPTYVGVCPNDATGAVAVAAPAPGTGAARLLPLSRSIDKATKATARSLTKLALPLSLISLPWAVVRPARVMVSHYKNLYGYTTLECALERSLR